MYYIVGRKITNWNIYGNKLVSCHYNATSFVTFYKLVVSLLSVLSVNLLHFDEQTVILRKEKDNGASRHWNEKFLVEFVDTFNG